MKKIFLTAATALALQGAMAQNSAVTNAILMQKAGTLDKARTEIDKAITNPKTSDKAKTWYTRGEIYEGIAQSPIYGKTLSPGEGTKVAFESYQKAIALEGKDSDYGKQATQRLDNIYGMALNAGVESYNAQKYDEALNSYRMAQQIRPQDTTALLYAAYASEAKQDYGQARDNYNKLMGINYKSPQMYNRLLQIARQEKNEAEAAKVVQQALAAYPTNKAFLLEDLNMTLSSGRGTEAIDKIQKVIAADPNNSNLYSVLGSVYEQSKQPEQALAAHKKAVELDPKNFDSQYNIGVYYFNKGAEIYKAVNKMDLKTYQAKGKKMEADGKKYMEQAIPYFETAIQINPSDRGVSSALQKAYTSVGRKADAEKLASQAK
ncbi:tetratricopeptide repeat protein [Hymenobacter busanensis]|uniref:Tetratricopeptide repeat protein n=1 Tax=Hymenobacter busanensis TaxID=2607656 RepID=A0A7L4ZU62_9BACT|nr:tetratricopeptide repeat protein [Hymenobacter busanensis]KAA9339878.1 tetratricopeptide repeat protein [Hymenobacter busanensis]QHJ06365.1 tetratricopeptide repeat protein [Hymenobacter busanensis]